MRQKNYASFTSEVSNQRPDHIIIGSGIGGLTAAAWLAKGGKKVMVLERHYVPGGFTHVFKRKQGFQWDVGVHYVGNVGEEDSLKGLFEFITDGALEWESMGDVYDVAIINAKRYEFRQGEEAFAAQMKEYFPKEIDAIDNYIALVNASNKRSAAFFLEKTFKPILQYTLGYFFRRRFQKYAQRTTYEVLRELTDNQTLIAVLCAQCGNYGLTPKRSSFAAHALVIGHFMKGGYYPKGGAEQLWQRTIDTINDNGGSVYINADVQEIVVEKNRVRGVRVENTFIPCKSVISNVGVLNTFQKLLPKKYAQHCRVSTSELERATAHFCLYVGLDASSEALSLPKHNVWWYAHNDTDAIINEATPKNAPEQFAYISFPSAKDPYWDKSHPNTATIQAISVAHYDWFKAYEEQPWRNREDAYKEMKESFKETMLARLFELFPQIESHVVITEVSTPLSTKHFTNYQKGEIYGLAHTPKRFKLPFLRSETKIKGLRLAGQDVTLVGVAGAMISGMLCATTILKFKSWKLFKQINGLDWKPDSA
ncbi:MAG: phytoene dehydrogenase [Flavobacteriaceae bacterium]|nr:phytoene dehydrogenase [Flavobacteriaceae bacterium]|tara:strand:+ start:5119 stop:6732 length:1614 start_codon:yes stop_codon:yes gene_type:complete